MLRGKNKQTDGKMRGSCKTGAYHFWSNGSVFVSENRKRVSQNHQIR